MFFNGIPVNDPENGWTIWSFWGGLNDVTRYPENKFGISSADATLEALVVIPTYLRYRLRKKWVRDSPMLPQIDHTGTGLCIPTTQA